MILLKGFDLNVRGIITFFEGAYKPDVNNNIYHYFNKQFN